MIDTSQGMKNNPWLSYGSPQAIGSPVASRETSIQTPQPGQEKSFPFQNLRQFPQQARQNVVDWGTYDKTLASNEGHPEMLRQYPFMMRWLYGQGAGGEQNPVPFGMAF